MGRAPRPTIINAENLKGLDDLDADADDGWAGGLWGFQGQSRLPGCEVGVCPRRPERGCGAGGSCRALLGARQPWLPHQAVSSGGLPLALRCRGGFVNVLKRLFRMEKLKL